jgi:hypothetical protein
MPDSGQTGFDLSDTVTVYVLADDGTLLDIIEEVDLGDPIEAWAKGRTSLKEAVLWGALAATRHRRGDLPRHETGGPS